MDIIKSNVAELKKLKPMKVQFKINSVLLTSFRPSHYCWISISIMENTCTWV